MHLSHGDLFAILKLKLTVLITNPYCNCATGCFLGSGASTLLDTWMKCLSYELLAEYQAGFRVCSRSRKNVIRVINIQIL